MDVLGGEEKKRKNRVRFGTALEASGQVWSGRLCRVVWSGVSRHWFQVDRQRETGPVDKSTGVNIEFWSILGRSGPSSALLLPAAALQRVSV